MAQNHGSSSRGVGYRPQTPKSESAPRCLDSHRHGPSARRSGGRFDQVADRTRVAARLPRGAAETGDNPPVAGPGIPGPDDPRSLSPAQVARGGVAAPMAPVAFPVGRAQRGTLQIARARVGGVEVSRSPGLAPPLPLAPPGGPLRARTDAPPTPPPPSPRPSRRSPTPRGSRPPSRTCTVSAPPRPGPSWRRRSSPTSA